MPETLARLLSLLFYLVHRMAGAEWLVAFGLSWWGLIKSEDAPQQASLLWAAAVLFILLGIAARAAGYGIFVPEEQHDAPRSSTPELPVAYGTATGYALRMAHHWWRIPLARTLVGEQVQVRWLSHYRPLAVFTPAGMNPKQMFPVEEAEEWSLWYSGSDVRYGRVYVAGQEHPGLELSFVGRKLLLALSDEDTAFALMRRLHAE